LDFDPKNKPEDAVYLSSLINNILAKLQEKVERQQGTLIFDNKEYKFYGFGDFVRMYVNYYKVQMNDMHGKIMGHDKFTKYDWIAGRLIEWIQKPDSEAKSKDILKELVDYCAKPNAEPKSPSEFSTRLDDIYKTIRKDVIARIMPEAEKQIDDTMFPIIWDALIKHVERQESLAVNFWLSSDEWSEHVLDSVQKLREEAPVPSSD